MEEGERIDKEKMHWRGREIKRPVIISPAASCMEGDVRLMIEDYYSADLTFDYDNLYIKDELKIGRVEVCVGGEFGSVCHDQVFRNSKAVSVVCWQLGFSKNGQSSNITAQHLNKCIALLVGSKCHCLNKLHKNLTIILGTEKLIMLLRKNLANMYTK